MQPIDQGIIRSLKAKYSSVAVKKLIHALEKKMLLPTFSILNAMFMLKKAWDAVPNASFTNCFRKADISVEAAESAVNNDDNPFVCLETDDEEMYETLNTDLNYLQANFGERIGIGLTPDDYIDFD
ncbi:uncharacterized protein LOC130612813 [Hydractinia symbiolongicarpus]|nr:uncharacterized protein LOC130612813 [Hydractinia symbiolongicarpus]